VTLLAAIRPDDWNLPLFLHVLGAMALVGALVLVAVAMAGHNLRLGYRTLLLVVIPSWIVMRLSAQWIYSKESLDDLEPQPGWIDIGFMTSEASFPLLIAATICAGIAARRARGSGLRTATLVLVGISLVAYVVAIWSMTNKPS
jgi:uncharacterized membrane protein YhiD involved in acid resistance